MNKIFVVLISVFFAVPVLATQQTLTETSVLESGFSHGEVRSIMDANTVKTNENNSELYGWGPSTGLEAIDEGNGTGWRLIGKDPDTFGNIGLNATDLSHSLSNSTMAGATGNWSFTANLGTEASGYMSFAEGDHTEASGDNGSHAEGWNTKAINTASHAAGKNNVGTSTETIHETGIGTDVVNRKNAFEIYTNGRIRAPELTIALLDDPRSLVTKEYADSSSVSDSFSNGDLSSNVLTVVHNLYDRALHVTVENDTGQVVLPTVQFVNLYTLTLDFSAFSVNNTWYYRVSK